MLNASQVSDGFFAHVIGGVIGGGVGWVMHALYRRWQRRRQHAEFDREVVGFATQLQSLVSDEQIPKVMARFVPVASKATYGIEIPPLKERYSLPQGVTLECDICKRTVEPTFEGRCDTCKLGITSYHRPRAKA